MVIPSAAGSYNADDLAGARLVVHHDGLAPALLQPLRNHARQQVAPFRGGPQQVQDVIGGRITLNFGTLSTGLQLMKQGQLKPIAITEPKRSTAAPDIPTVAETIPGFSVQSFYGFVAPQGTPREIIATIQGDMVAVIKTPEVASLLAAGGFEVMGSKPEEFDRYLADQLQRWAAIVKKTGITSE